MLSKLLEQNITNCSCCGLGSQLPSLLLLEGNWEVMSTQHPSTRQSLHLDRITSEAGNLGSDRESGRRQKRTDSQLGKGRPQYAVCFPPLTSLLAQPVQTHLPSFLPGPTEIPDLPFSASRPHLAHPQDVSAAQLEAGLVEGHVSRAQAATISVS